LRDEHFDLVWALSVFTHLTDYWSDWLLELHRVLRPGGRLVSTFLGEGMSQSIAGERWDADRIGMNVLRAWQRWDQGGPSVQHSEWWLREHWGRAFEVESVADGPQFGHGLIVLKKRPVTLTREELIEPARGGDPRELNALLHNASQLVREAIEQRELQALRAGLDAACEALRVIATSRSWRLAHHPRRTPRGRARARTREGLARRRTWPQ
jgi:SAM-dependent methyltransferase